MENILRIDTVSGHDAFYHQENLHPLVSVIDFTGRTPEIYAAKMNFGFYAVYLKDVKCGDMKYGRHTYDYQDRTLVFVAPGQIIHVDINEEMIGLPSVAYCADQLHLSANYFGDLIKKETGKTPTEYIHLKVIALAKEKILDPGKSVSEIAFELGFKYPQHFTRFFKKTTGVAPNDYRSLR